MANRQIYQINDLDWATSAELVLNEPEDSSNLFLGAETPHPVQFAVFALSTPEGQWSDKLDSRLAVLDSDLRPVEMSPRDTERYLSEDRRVAILIQPQARAWRLSVEHGRMPVAATAMAFHPAPSGGHPPRLRCRVCRSTAKALALAIAAALGALAAGVALPAALIAAVGSFLGVASAAAVAFINSVVGDAASVIADKLCLAVGLCP